MTPKKSDVLYGTLGLMIIKTLEAMGPLHGYRIARRIEQISGNQLALNQGTLYPALLKLEQMGWISSTWGTSETGRRVRIYSLTRAGRRQLQKDLREGRSALWDVEQWRAQSRTFADIATFDSVLTLLAGADGVEQIVGASISPNLVGLLGVEPALGRSFSAEEAEQRQRLVMISHRFWQERFGGSPDALGATLVLNGLPSQIIGILPADFRIGRFEADVWEPHTTSPGVRGPQTWFVVGRLRSGATFEQAQSEMSTIARRLSDQLPAAERNQGIAVVPLSLYLVGPQSRLALWTLGGAVFCVFLIAAANVTSLSLARSTARAREMALRAALGANAGRIVRQLLTENILLAGVAGLVGTLLAFGGIQLIRAFGPDNLPRLDEVSLDLRVLAWALTISLGAPRQSLPYLRGSESPWPSLPFPPWLRVSVANLPSLRASVTSWLTLRTSVAPCLRG